MSYIQSYGTALPHFRIEECILNPKARKNTMRSVCYTDEDIITLSFEAAKECLEIFSETPSAIFFATSSPIFYNRYHASFLGDLLGLPQTIFAMDFVNSNRSGTDAFLIANELINSKKHASILVIVADVKYPKIGEELLNSTGHAACAFLLNSKNTQLEITTSDSVGAHLAEEFSYKNNFIRLDPRFSREEGFKKNMIEVVKLISKNVNSTEKIILNSAYSKMAGPVFMKAGFNEGQFSKDSLSSKIGNSGCVHALLQLIVEIENGAKNCILIDYTNGSNLFTVVAGAKLENKSFQQKLGTFESVTSYQDYLLLRKEGNFSSIKYSTREMFSSEMMNEREKDAFIRLNGLKCCGCGTNYFIKTIRCKKCKSEKFEAVKFADTGKVYSFTHEHYFPVSFAPVTMLVINMNGGGRITVQQTNTMYPEKNKIEIGSEVKLVLRKIIERDEKPNYYLKAIQLS